MSAWTTGVPTDIESFISAHTMCDWYYSLPRIVEAFIGRLNSEQAGHAVAKPWTLNRCVTVFYKGGAVGVFPYDWIEHNIVECLDHASEVVRKGAESAKAEIHQDLC